MVDEQEKIYYTLEDIYTPIDRSIVDSSSFKNYTPHQLLKLRDDFNRLIILAVRNEIEKSTKSDQAIKKFAQHIVNESKVRLRDEKKDGVAVITTNWDIMLDNNVNQILNDEPRPKGHKFSGVLDYCCYISSLDEHDHRIKPGLYAIGKGRFNVKILKLHGSLNWLQCPKCHRLYVKFYKKWAGGYVFNRKYCRHCEKNFGEIKQVSNQLTTNLIMPTFLKNLNNIQHKLIWQNAGIELSEASKVVFMGYSLPQADFEFKQLLSRMIRPDAKIEVVLRKSDDPSVYEGSMKYQTAGYRFSNFFSGRAPVIHYDGVGAYIDKLG
jgi:NAD-dependent SIR2 family protein deacetylase